MSKYNWFENTSARRFVGTYIELYGDLVHKFREIGGKTDFFKTLYKDCHSLLKDRLKNDYSAANCRRGC